MTMEELQAMGLEKEAAEKILKAFTAMEEEKSSLEAEVQRLQAVSEEDKLAKAEEEKKRLLEKAILEGGGKNVKAILALLQEEEITVNNGKLTGFSLEQVKKEAPYLFHEKEAKVGGTGYQKSKRKENEISTAFKNALRR